jgi:hypothetical protein
MQTILFACVHNAGRSQMAEALFNQLADPAKARAISAHRQEMQRIGPVAKGSNGWVYGAVASAARAAADYTPRLLPQHPTAAVPLEAGQILWQR